MDLKLLPHIIDHAPAFLKPNDELANVGIPQLVLEIGFRQSGQVKELFDHAGYCHIEIEKDLEGKDRIACARVVPCGYIKQTVEDIVALAFKPQYLAYAHIKKTDNQVPYSMVSYKQIPFTDLELEKQIIFNPTQIGKHLHYVLCQQSLCNADIRISYGRTNNL